jgi:hypothetical protein
MGYQRCRSWPSAQGRALRRGDALGIDRSRVIGTRVRGDQPESAIAAPRAIIARAVMSPHSGCGGLSRSIDVPNGRNGDPEGRWVVRAEPSLTGACLVFSRGARHHGGERCPSGDRAHPRGRRGRCAVGRGRVHPDVRRVGPLRRSRFRPARGERRSRDRRRRFRPQLGALRDGSPAAPMPAARGTRGLRGLALAAGLTQWSDHRSSR